MDVVVITALVIVLCYNFIWWLMDSLDGDNFFDRYRVDIHGGLAIACWFFLLSPLFVQILIWIGLL